MQGIGSGITQQARPAANGGNGNPPRSPNEGGEEQSNVTPEEQAQYDQFVNNAIEVIYPQGEQGMSSVVQENLQGQFDPKVMEYFATADPPLNPQSPTDALAAASVLVVLYLEASAEQAGKPIPDEIVYNGGAEVVEVLADDGEKMGLFALSDEQVEGAFYRAVDLYRISSPRVDPQALAQEFNEIVAADEAGQLEQALPGIGQQRAAAA